MSPFGRPRPARLGVESLEGRMMLSGSARPAMVRAAAIGGLHASAIKTDRGAVAAITAALGGGIGSEWATLIRRQVRNPLSVAAGFASGRIAAYSMPGLTFRKTAAQVGFIGRLYDQLEPTVAGAALFKGGVFELASVLRGEFRDPDPTQYVFGIDRGAGARLGPAYASRPGITPDALVTISAGPFGSSPTGTIRDLTDGSSREIDASRIAIRGATLRVFLGAGDLPTRGAKLAKYRFAMWTQAEPGGDIASVANFAPGANMIPIAVLKDVAARR